MLRDKKILIISPQPWGEMILSKQHYALTLQRLGSQVYFLNPPTYSLRVSGLFKSKPSKIVEGVVILSYYHHTILYYLKFKWLRVYSFLTGFFHLKINKIVKPDILWVCDSNTYIDYRYISRKKFIYHPVDFFEYSRGNKIAKQADIIFSVAHEILDDIQDQKAKKFFINHSISEEFLGTFVDLKPKQKEKNIKVGYSGNLLRSDIDYEVLLKLINYNKHIEFHFYGSNGLKKSNLNTQNSDTSKKIKEIFAFSNVFLHGVLDKKELAGQLRGMNILIICYDPKKDMCKGTNYLKVMEFLSTGKVIISNHITTYKDLGIIEMCKSLNDNDDFIDIFNNVCNNLSEYNSTSKSSSRIQFAIDNTYDKQIDKIDILLSSTL